MVILQDSREQKPLRFSPDEFVEGIKVQKLEVGDYQCQYKDGGLSKIVVERKSLADLWGTMTSGYSRFKKEMERSKNLGLILLIAIEASFSEVMDGFDRSQFSGNSMIKKLGTLFFKHGLVPVFFTDRDEMASFIIELFKAEGFHRLRVGAPAAVSCNNSGYVKASALVTGGGS